MDKIFTFQFYFTHPATGEDDEIQFCAHTYKEAELLFLEWADYEMDYNPDDIYDWDDIVCNIQDVEVVYNQYDADEYGAEYGTPEEYQGE